MFQELQLATAPVQEGSIVAIAILDELDNWLVHGLGGRSCRPLQLEFGSGISDRKNHRAAEKFKGRRFHHSRRGIAFSTLADKAIYLSRPCLPVQSPVRKSLQSELNAGEEDIADLGSTHL